MLQNSVLPRETQLVASQFGVVESIPTIFESIRCVLEAAGRLKSQKTLPKCDFTLRFRYLKCSVNIAFWGTSFDF